MAATETTSATKKDRTYTHEVSIFVGGPRNGRTYFTEDLESNTGEHPLSEGYRKTGDFQNHRWPNMVHPAGWKATKDERVPPPIKARIWVPVRR